MVEKVKNVPKRNKIDTASHVSSSLTATGNAQPIKIIQDPNTGSCEKLVNDQSVHKEIWTMILILPRVTTVKVTVHLLVVQRCYQPKVKKL